MTKFKRFTLLATAAATSIVMATTAQAQSTASAIRVKVEDTNGNALANVSVIIRHIPTGRIIERETNATGQVLARGLQIGGPYEVILADEAQRVAQGSMIDSLRLELGETEAVTLLGRAPGGETVSLEEVTITAERMVSQLRVGPGRDFTSQEILDIPSISRDFTSALAIDPQIVVDDSVPRGPAVSIAGQNFRFNTLTIDGVTQNDNFGLSFNASATQRSPISNDAIAAINVNAAPFDVTFGNFVGGNINIVTKSGTNEFHGSAYGFYTDEGLSGNRSGNDRFDFGGFNEWVVGGTFEGPIVEDKLFFFVNYERFETEVPANSVPIDLINGVTQADVDRAISIFQNEYGFDPGRFATTDTDRDEKILVKINWNISDRHRAVGTYQRADGDVLFDDFPETAVLNSNRYNINETLDSFSFQLFSDWTDDLSTEFRVGYKDVTNRQVSVDSSTPAFAIGITDENGVPTGGNIFAGGDQFRQANELDNSSLFIRAKADYTVGDHTLTVGFEREQIDVRNEFRPFSRGQLNFTGLDALEARQVDFVLFGGSTSGVAADAESNFDLVTNTLYAQDEWAATDTLTLKFGLRYDWIENSNDPVPLNPNFVDRNGFANTFNLDGEELFSPRFGFTWDATERLTVRGGAGLFGGGTPSIFLSNSYAANGLTRVFAGFFAPFFGPPISDAIATALSNAPAADSVSSQLQPFLSASPANDVDAISPDFDILSSWKYNIGLDYVADLSSLGLGDDWDISLDFTYSDVNDGYDIYEGRRRVIGQAPDGRPIYNDNGFNDADYIVRNTNLGDSTIISLNVAKYWQTENYGNFDLNLGYTYQDVNDVRSYSRFVNFETFSFDPAADLNNAGLSTSLFEIRNRITAKLTWDAQIFGENTTRFTIFYQGRDGRPGSYVFDGGNLPFGGNGLADGINADSPGGALLYVPTGLNDPLVTGDAAFLADLNAFIDSEQCLSNARGSILGRNSCRPDFVNRIDLNLSQEVEVMDGHFVEFIVNIQNFLNMLDSDAGRNEPFTLGTPSNLALVRTTISDDGSQYVYSPVGGAAAFSAPQSQVAQLQSVYRVQFGLRYRF